MSTLTNLDFSRNPSGIHAAGHIHCVSPDIIERLYSTNDTSNDWTMVESYREIQLLSIQQSSLSQHTYPQLELIEAMLIDEVQFLLDFKSKLCHGNNVSIFRLWCTFVCLLVGQTTSCHIRSTYGLYLLNFAVLWLL